MKTFKRKLQPLKIMAAVAIISCFFNSCKKETEVVTVTTPPTPTVETDPISTAFFLNTNYRITTPPAGNTFELGSLFTVNKNGKILRLGTRMPSAGTYRVTLWDETRTQIGQATVTQSADGIPAFSSITPVSVTTGKTYVISIWVSAATKVFYIDSQNGATIVYPITSGNIKITGYQFIVSAQTPITYPTQSSIDSFSGLADIEFLAD